MRVTRSQGLSWLRYTRLCDITENSMANLSKSQSRCPTDASLLAPCVCSKRNVAEDVRTTISRSVRYSCGNTEDVTMAFNFFDEYCAMNEGTTTFAKPESPPGDSKHCAICVQARHVDSYSVLLHHGVATVFIPQRVRAKRSVIYSHERKSTHPLASTSKADMT